MKEIIIGINDLRLRAVLHDTPAAQQIWDSLPIQTEGNIWGEEIYFTVDARIALENGQEIVEAGDLGYWPPGSAFCIFYGMTPLSRNGQIRAASAVEVFGRIMDDYNVLKKIRSSPRISISRYE